MLFSHGIVCLLLAGLFAGASGWLVRRLVEEANGGSVEALRAKLREAVGAIEAHRARHDSLAEEAARERALADEAGRRAAELEAAAGVHEQHILALADEAAERDREGRALQAQLDDVRLRVRQLSALVPESAEHEYATLRLARDAAREEAEELAEKATEAAELQRRLDALTRERDAELAALRQQVRRLEPLAARCREAELKADAVARDRDTQVAGLRARADELEARLRTRPESERVRKSAT